MSLLVTPSQLARRGDLYIQLSQLTAAGIGLLQGLEMQENHPPLRAFREPLARIRAQLETGASFSEALATVPRFAPAFDHALLHAGEQSGRLPSCFKLLAEHYTEAARLLRITLAGLAYPALLLHVAVLLAPLPDLIPKGDVLLYLAKVFGVLLPCYAVIGMVMFAMQDGRSERWRGFVERVAGCVPVFGAARRELALARLAAALESLLAAGVNIIEAWQLAANASGSPALRNAVHAWRPRVEAGLTPSDALGQSRAFPELFTSQYRTGEISGSLDDTLRRLHTLYREQGSARMRAFAIGAPWVFYLGVAFLVAWRVIAFWLGYFKKIGDAMNF